MGPSSPPPPGITGAPPESASLTFFPQIAQCGSDIPLWEEFCSVQNFFHFQLMEAPELLKSLLTV